MVKQLAENLQTLHMPLKTENQKIISKFARMMSTINKLEERMDSFRNEMCLFFKISQILKPSPQNLNENSINFNENNENDVFLSDDEREPRETKEISGVYGEYAKKLVMGAKLQNFVEIYAKMKEKKAQHVEFFSVKLNELTKEMALFKELDNPRLLYLLRKVQKLKRTLISLLPENQIGCE